MTKDHATDNIGTFDGENPNIRYSKKNITLTNSNLNEYLNTGKTRHTRNRKKRMLSDGKSPLLYSDEDTKKFIDDIIDGKALGEVRAFAKVGATLSNYIGLVYNEDIYGRWLELNADALLESYKKHNKAKELGDIDLSREDFESIPEMLNGDIIPLSYNKYKGKVEIQIAQKSKNGFIKIITVVSNERNSLQITKLIGNSEEKFLKKYGKKIERYSTLEGENTPNTHKASQYKEYLSSDSILQTSEKKQQ